MNVYEGKVKVFELKLEDQISLIKVESLIKDKDNNIFKLTTPKDCSCEYIGFNKNECFYVSDGLFNKIGFNNFNDKYQEFEIKFIRINSKDIESKIENKTKK